MPTQVLHTVDALEYLDSIWEYIARDSFVAADKTIDQLGERIRLLAASPELGERQPLLADGSYRRFCVQNYVIYYLPVDDGIVVVRILHGARDHQEEL